MRLLQDLYRKHGKTFRAKFLGVDVIYTSDPQKMQTINTIDFDNFLVSLLRRPANDSWVGGGIFFDSDGHEWKLARNIIMYLILHQKKREKTKFGLFL